MAHIHSLRLSEKTIRSTVRIEFQTEDKEVHGGTGFLFEFSTLPNATVIISNRHVAEKAVTGGFVFNRADENDNLLQGQKIPFLVENFSKCWIFHPDPTVDLAMMPIGGLINHFLSQGKRPFYGKIISNTIPDRKNWEKFHALEDVLVVGYPDMIMDSVNNLPLTIKGTTATHPNIDYDGNEEFLVSAWIYPGSSGSPVLILDENYYEKSRNLHKGRDRVKLIGVIRSGFEYDIEGKIVRSDPIYRLSSLYDNSVSVTSKIPMGITKAIRSTKIMDFEHILKKKLDELEQHTQ